MYKVLFTLLVCFTTILNANGQIRAISTNKLARHLKFKQLELIDVRTSREFETGFISGAKNLDVNDAAFIEKAKLLDPGKAIILYCRTGKRSEKAAKMLIEEGFDKVYFLKGGITEWGNKTNDNLIERQ